VRLRQEIQALSRHADLNPPAGLRADAARAATIDAIAGLFAQAGVEDCLADARLLLCAAAGVTRSDLIRAPDAAVGAATIERLAPMVGRRVRGEPVSRILGRREFWGLPLALSPDVLDPRPDTETLVEAVLSESRQRRRAPLRILDLGVGSGAILCALLTEFPIATGIGVDVSAPAARLARANLAACGLEARARVVVGSWGAALRGGFDIVVSNPPYVARAAIRGLAREVRDHDPALSLDGGADGLDAYRAIAPALAALLGAGGRFYLEIGAGQAAAVGAILAARGLAAPATYRDLAGFTRIVAGGASGPEDGAAGAF
jgi:release factor glutamine methyltransferase